jgi:dsRNA-specific ribonuclease
MLQDVASNKNLARAARKIGLADHLVTHAGQIHHVDGPSDDVLATALQAVIGAIDRDSSCESKHEVVRAAMNKIGLTAAATK